MQILGATMRRAFVLLFALILSLSLAVPGFANNTWNNYHWADGRTDDHDGSISLDLVDDLTRYGTEYGKVLTDWDGAPGPLTLSSTGGGSRPDACDNVATDQAGLDIARTIHVCNGTYGRNGWLGLARIWLTGDGHIEAGVALMNDSYFQEPGSVYNDPGVWRHVLCQEVGHTFGLDHQKRPGDVSCMNDRWGLTDERFQGPNQHDFDTLNEIYGIASGDDGDGGGGNDKPCNPNRPNCPSNGSNVQFAPRAGGGWIETFTVSAGQVTH